MTLCPSHRPFLLFLLYLLLSSLAQSSTLQDSSLISSDPLVPTTICMLGDSTIRKFAYSYIHEILHVDLREPTGKTRHMDFKVYPGIDDETGEMVGEGIEVWFFWNPHMYRQSGNGFLQNPREKDSGGSRGLGRCNMLIWGNFLHELVKDDVNTFGRLNSVEETSWDLDDRTSNLIEAHKKLESIVGQRVPVVYFGAVYLRGEEHIQYKMDLVEKAWMVNLQATNVLAKTANVIRADLVTLSESYDNPSFSNPGCFIGGCYSDFDGFHYPEWVQQKIIHSWGGRKEAEKMMMETVRWRESQNIVSQSVFKFHDTENLGTYTEGSIWGDEAAEQAWHNFLPKMGEEKWSAFLKKRGYNNLSLSICRCVPPPMYVDRVARHIPDMLEYFGSTFYMFLADYLCRYKPPPVFATDGEDGNEDYTNEDNHRNNNEHQERAFVDSMRSAIFMYPEISDMVDSIVREALPPARPSPTICIIAPPISSTFVLFSVLSSISAHQLHAQTIELTTPKILVGTVDELRLRSPVDREYSSIGIAEVTTSSYANVDDIVNRDDDDNDDMLKSRTCDIVLVDGSVLVRGREEKGLEAVRGITKEGGTLVVY
eukprot:CAMPEP_0118665388 /NCGR_PEP_ID=MMETSP0785-20121206/18595_1 /TAXON_ID=91992 /ORGANISM="Bolidomonas pacifica, Strain CCMP 1866" /LENGTH=596 /DNA_ID=CAMNT_0006559509 /DNA_START=37 /DNA_END=1825 /DNA_ORIENTATION=+